MTTFTSTTDGNINDGGTYGNTSPGVAGTDFPDSDDICVAGGSTTITLNVDYEVRALKITGTIAGGGNTITVNGATSNKPFDNDGTITGDLNVTITNTGIQQDGLLLDAMGTSGNINNLTLNLANGTTANKTVGIASSTTIDNTLTITSGTFDTVFDGGASQGLSVGGATTIENNGTLKCNNSTVDLTGGNVTGSGTGTLALDTCTLTAGNLYPKKITADAASVTCSDYFGVSTNTDLTVSSGAALAVSCRRLQLNSVTATSPNWSVTFVGDLASRTIKLGSGELHDVTLNMTADATDIQHLGQNTTIGGNLTITSGVLDTNENSGDNFSLTVTGEVNVAGTLTCNSSVCSFGSLASTGLTNLADSSGSTLITNENSDGLSIVAGTFGTCVPAKIKHNNGTVTFNNHSDPAAHAAIVCGNSNATDGLYNVIIDGANTIVDTYDPGGAGQECKIHNNFTVTNGSFQVNGASNPFDVGGDVLVSAGKMFGDGAAPTGAMSFGSLTIASGAEFKATTGTTTITSEAGSGYAVEFSGTYTHSSGTLKITTDANTFVKTNDKTYNLVIEAATSTRVYEWVNNTTIQGDLTVNAGRFTHYSSSYTLTVTGDVTTTSGGNLDCGSTTVSMNSLTNEGTFVASSGNTTILVDIRNRTGATFTHSGGTVLITTGATYFIHNTGSYSTITFNNLTYSGVNCYLVKDIIVEGTLSNPSGYIRLTSGAKITLGTTTSQGTLAMGSNKLFPYATWYLYGASELYPGIVTGTNATPIKFSYGEGGANSANLKWLDIQFDINDVGGDDNYTITLDGSCEFDAVTIDADCTLDLNGQRAVFGGAFDLTTGALAMNDAMAVFKHTIDFNGRVPTSNTGTTIIHNPPSTSEKLITSLYFGGTFFAQGAESDVNGYAWQGASGSGEYPAKVFVGGQLDCQQSVKTTTTMQVATGGELRGNDRTITCEGDLTMSGGLIGKSALSFPDGGNSPSGAGNYLDVPYDLVNLTGDATIEFWMKAAANTNDASRGIINGYKGGTANRWQLYQTTSNNMTFYSHDYNKGITVTCPTGKWTHVAIVCTGAGGDVKLYIDGKLEGQTDLGGSVSLATSGAFPDFGVNRQLDSTDLRTGTRLFEGNLAMLRIWTDERTESELRANMFATYANLASNTGCAIAYDFDEGTGTDVDDEVGSNNGTLVNVTWAGTGTFTMGTSTLDFTGNGQWALSDTTTDYYNVKVAASGKTTTINSVGGSEKRPRINNLLTHGGGTLTDISNADITFYGTGSHTAGADLSGLYITYWPSSTDMPGGTYQYLITQHNDLSTTGNINCGGYFAVSSGEGFDLKTHTLTTGRMILYANTTFNIDAGSLIFDSTSGMTGDYTGRTFTAGPGATITGVAAKSGFFSGNNYSVVGKIENLDVTNEELKVTGQVINCTGDIHQYFPTIDHAQQLDADTADDRDVRLGRDLDKNTELINS
jgi:fibronectin-binding autotransporter adhesin